MRLIGLMGGLAGLFTDALRFTGWQQPNYQRRYGNKSTHRAAFRRGPRTDAPRHWHDLKQPSQVARLQAAKGKRARRADNAEHYAIRSFVFNNAHKNGPYAPNLDPTYVAK